MTTALAGFVVMLLGFFAGVPLSIVLFTVGFFGFALAFGFDFGCDLTRESVYPPEPGAVTFTSR